MPTRRTNSARPALEPLEPRDAPAAQILAGPAALMARHDDPAAALQVGRAGSANARVWAEAAGEAGASALSAHGKKAASALAAPVAPGSFAASAVSGSRVRLTWADTAGEDGYRVFRWTGSAWVKAADLNAGTTSYEVSGLSAGKTYHFYVEAYNAAGGAKTRSVSVTTHAPPTVPGSFTATALSATQVRLSWADSSGEQGYRIHQWTGSAWVKVGDAGPGVTSHEVSGLEAGKTYYFYVEAYNAAGSSRTAHAAVTTLGPPAVPGSFAGEALSGKQVRLSWSAPGGQDGYRVFQWDGSAWQHVGSAGAGDTSYVVSGLTGGRNYYFYLEAYNAIGSTKTRLVTVATSPALDPPASLTATLRPGGGVRLSWADTVGEDGYRIYRWNGSTWSVVGSVGRGLISYDLTGLARHQTYYFYVEAFNAAGSAATGWLQVTLG